MSDKTISLVQHLFAEWGKAGVCYVVLRGWTGNELVGSDIDILLDSESWPTAVSLAEKVDFQQVTRGWKLFDFGATERYLDKKLNGHLVRLHLSNRLLFGKPMRKIRLPYETAVLRQAAFDTPSQSFKSDLSWQQAIDLYRLAIDKPEKMTATTIADWTFESSYLPPSLVAGINQLLPDVYQFVNGRLSAAQLEAAAIASLAPLPGSQYRLRQVQTAFSQLLIMATRLLYKVRLVIGLGNTPGTE